MRHPRERVRRITTKRRAKVASSRLKRGRRPTPMHGMSPVSLSLRRFPTMHTAAATPTATRPTASQAEALWRAWVTRRRLPRPRPARPLLLADGSLPRLAQGARAAGPLRSRRPRVVRADRPRRVGRPLRPRQGRHVRAVRLDARQRRDPRRAAPPGLGPPLRPPGRPQDRAGPREVYGQEGRAPTEQSSPAIRDRRRADPHALDELGRAELLSLNAPARWARSG